MRTNQKKKECAFCGSKLHNSHDCPRFTTMSRRRTILRKKAPCYVCASSHLAASCPVTEPKCQICNKVGHLLHLCISHMISINAKNKKEVKLKLLKFSSSNFEIISLHLTGGNFGVLINLHFM